MLTIGAEVFTEMKEELLNLAEKVGESIWEDVSKADECARGYGLFCLSRAFAD